MSTVGPQLLAELVDRHGGPLVLFAQQWCASPEDVVQEAFFQLVQESERPANVVGWLYRVVRNGAIAAARSAGRRWRREAAVAHRGEPWFNASPDEGLDAALATEALGQLPLEQREVIVARLWGGLSLDEVAELTGASTSTVHRRYHAGLSTLREKMGVPCQPMKKTTNA